MNNKKYFSVMAVLLCFLLFMLGNAYAIEKINSIKKYAPIVVSFTRHTFRGISKTIPSAAPIISNLKIKNTVLAYGMDATTNGLAITKKFAEKAYNNGAQLALKTIGDNPKLAGHWNKIRTDLATQRTFATAVNLQEGLVKNTRRKIVLVGCPTSEGIFVDSITASSPLIASCISSQWVTRQEQNATKLIISKKFIALANHLISLLGGKPDVSESNFNAYFPHIKALCNQIEMSSDLGGFPLRYVLENSSITSHAINREAVVIALQLLGYSLLVDSSNIDSETTSLIKANYIDSLKNGSQEIIVSHDTKIGALLNNLNFISTQSASNDLAIYPLETVTIALNAKRVAIVRTRINVDQDGSMTGKAGFKSWVFWSGSRKEWSDRVDALRNKIKHHANMGCLQKIPLCQPVTVHLLLHQDNSVS